MSGRISRRVTIPLSRRCRTISNVDHVAAVRVELDDGSNRYFLTLGRAFDSAEPQELLQLVVEHAGNCDLQAKVRHAHICQTIREAAESPDAPFFYEALLAVGRLPMPSGERQEAWRRRARRTVRRGENIYDCGSPSRR